jgi:hypothetical protein
MTEYWIVTSGRGMLPAGRKMGDIAANSPEDAEDALIRAGTISARYRGHFRFEPKSAR